MAKWMARKAGLLGTRLEVTQVPEEGRSVHEPVWSKVNLETLLDIVEHLNSKNETIKCLFEEVQHLKTYNERLTELAFGRPRQMAHPKPNQDILGDFGIKQEAVMVTINAPDAVNGEIAEMVRRAARYEGCIPTARDRCEPRMDYEDRPVDNSTSTDSSSSSPTSSD